MNSVDARWVEFLGKTSDEAVISRKEWVELALDDALWADLSKAKEGAKIVKVPFSTDNGQKINRSGSDYYKALNQTLDENDNLKAVIVLGDGDYNIGEEPLKVAQKAKRNRKKIALLQSTPY